MAFARLHTRNIQYYLVAILSILALRQTKANHILSKGMKTRNYYKESKPECSQSGALPLCIQDWEDWER